MMPKSFKFIETRCFAKYRALKRFADERVQCTTVSKQKMKSRVGKEEDILKRLCRIGCIPSKMRVLSWAPR